MLHIKMDKLMNKREKKKKKVNSKAINIVVELKLPPKSTITATREKK